MELDLPLRPEPSRVRPEPSRAPRPEPPPSPDPEELAARRTRWRRRLVAFGLPAAVMVMAAVTGVVVGASIRKPEVEAVDHFVPRLVTELVDRQGRPFRSYSRENRILLDETEVPKLLQQAILAAEDGSFFDHGGIDLKGVIRAAWSNFREGRHSQGASTITMQLARELFLSRDKNWRRKVEEAFLAVELEKRYSKQQILTLYANLVNLGQGNYGMEAGSRAYFNKSVADLTVVEAATLAGIPQRPSSFNVYTNPDAVRRRRNYVLGRMRDDGYLSEEQHRLAIAEPLIVVPRRRESHLGPYFAEEVRRHLQSTYGTAALYDRGLRVETTLDTAIQRATEDAVRENLVRLAHRRGWRGAREHFDGEGLEERRLPSWTDAEPLVGSWYEGLVLDSGGQTATVRIGPRTYELSKDGIAWTHRPRPSDVLKRGDVAWFRLVVPERKDAKKGEPPPDPILTLEQEPEAEAAAIVLESATGAVRALVGGWDFDRNEFDRATQAVRQVGSAFKPFVIGAALEAGFTPADTVFDGPVVFTGADGLPSYSPRNYYRRYYGILTLRRVLELSINVASVKLLDMVGVDNVVDFARRCGVGADLPPYPSLALGVADIRPIELAAAYAAVANQGVYVEPYLIEKVTSRDGRVLEERRMRAHKAMEPQVAYVLLQMLRGVAQRGTAASLASLDVALAGKTGTTDSYTDAWFVGSTPKHTLLVWVGYDHNRSLGRGMTGAEAALPAWRAIVERGLAEGWVEKGAKFVRPPGIAEVAIDRDTGLRASDASARILVETFVAGTEPEQELTPRWGRIVSLPWYQQAAFYIPKEGERMPSEISDWTLVRDAWERKSERRN